MKEETILICGDGDGKYPWTDNVKEICADCGKDIVRRPDAEVPEEATKLCLPCAIKRMDEATAAGDPPEIQITKQNMELLNRLGYKLKTEGSC